MVNNYKIRLKKIGQLFLLLALFLPLTVQSNLIDDLSRKIQEHEAKRIELERQAQEYERIINQKQQEIKSLNNQIAIYNARINKIQAEINITQDEIAQTELEILKLGYDIKDAQTEIGKNKNGLAEIIQSIAEFDQASQLEIILKSDDFSEYFNQMAYLDNLQYSVRQKIIELKELKENLYQNKEEQEDKKQKLENLQKQLESQQYSLAEQRNSQRSLLNYTAGQEEKYQQMLAQIEEQKKEILGNINSLIQQRAAELARLKESQQKPPSQYWASTNWFYRQNDSRWGNTTIGLSNSKLSDYGCAISSVAMVFSYHGEIITPPQLAKESIYYSNLIIWPARWGSLQKVVGTYRTPADWFRIDRELGAGYPVIVRIQADGYSGAHYVVIHHKTDDGRYVVHDPLFGANIYLSSSRAYIGKLYDTTTSINQMIIYH